MGPRIDDVLYQYAPVVTKTTEPVATENVEVVTTPTPSTTAVTSNPFEQAQNTPKEVETEENQYRFNSEEMYEKYKRNPTEILDKLGINFTEEQISKLQTVLKDKKALRAFLTIAEKENLTAEDTFAAFESVMNKKSSNIFKRGWIWITNGGKSEREVHARDLSTNMSTVREIRGDELTTRTVVSIGEYASQGENERENVMHFVEQKNDKDEFIYSEQNIIDATAYMIENPEETNNFVSNVMSIESIRNEKGENKYNGDTNISVGRRMTDNPKLAGTMRKTANKSDMTAEYLENITANLEKNPHMQKSIEFSLDAKNDDGTDRFTANSINTESYQLVDKNEAYCARFEANLRELAQYGNITAEDIVTIADNVTKHPEIKNDVISKIQSGTMTSSEIAEYTNTYAEEHTSEANYGAVSENNATPNYSSTEVEKEEAGATENVNNNTNPEIYEILTQNEDNIEEEAEAEPETKIEYDGQIYSKEEFKERYKEQFGTLTDSVIEAIMKDPNCIEFIQNYSLNRDILEAYLKEPELVKSFVKTGMSKAQLSEVLSICNNKTTQDIMLLAIDSGYDITAAIKYVKMAKITNSGDDVMAILRNTTTSPSIKHKKINQLFGIEKQYSYCA